jgi:hypothetical protein
MLIESISCLAQVDTCIAQVSLYIGIALQKLWEGLACILQRLANGLAICFQLLVDILAGILLLLDPRARVPPLNEPVQAQEHQQQEQIEASHPPPYSVSSYCSYCHSTIAYTTLT